MNPTLKGGVIGGGSVVAGYLGDLVLYVAELVTKIDFPDKIDLAITGIVAFGATWLLYQVLPVANQQ